MQLQISWVFPAASLPSGSIKPDRQRQSNGHREERLYFRRPNPLDLVASWVRSFDLFTSYIRRSSIFNLPIHIICGRLCFYIYIGLAVDYQVISNASGEEKKKRKGKPIDKDDASLNLSTVVFRCILHNPNKVIGLESI